MCVFVSVSDTKTQDTKTQGHKDTEKQGRKDIGGTRRHRRDTKTREGHKDTGGTQRRRRDTKTREGEITHRHFRRIRGELTDQKDFIRGDH